MSHRSPCSAGHRAEQPQSPVPPGTRCAGRGTRERPYPPNPEGKCQREVPPHHSRYSLPQECHAPLSPTMGITILCAAPHHTMPPTAFPQQSSLRSPFHTPQHHGETGDPPWVSVLSVTRPVPRAPGWPPRDNGHPWALGTGLMHGAAWGSQENRGMPVPQPGWPMWSPLATLCQLPRRVALQRARGFWYY